MAIFEKTIRNKNFDKLLNTYKLRGYYVYSGIGHSRGVFYNIL